MLETTQYFKRDGYTLFLSALITAILCFFLNDYLTTRLIPGVVFKSVLTLFPLIFIGMWTFFNVLRSSWANFKITGFNINILIGASLFLVYINIIIGNFSEFFNVFPPGRGFYASQFCEYFKMSFVGAYHAKLLCTLNILFLIGIFILGIRTGNQITDKYLLAKASA